MIFTYLPILSRVTKKIKIQIFHCLFSYFHVISDDSNFYYTFMYQLLEEELLEEELLELKELDELLTGIGQHVSNHCANSVTAS